MHNIFFASDHHFGHANILNFLADGHPLRVFDHVDHMNEHMIEQHNKVVRPEDKTYFLGDVAMGSAGLRYLDRMNGTKVLIKGNHDRDKLSNYAKYFKDVRATHLVDKMVLSHVPIHPQSLVRWNRNVHGHLHSNRIMNDSGRAINPHYLCVCMEQIDYTPISLEEVRKRFDEAML